VLGRRLGGFRPFFKLGRFGAQSLDLGTQAGDLGVRIGEGVVVGRVGHGRAPVRLKERPRLHRLTPLVAGATRVL
jgi:hypothetical protein